MLGELPRGYDHKYIYSHIGYNLKATEMQAALGLSQIEKLPGFIQSRKDNFNLLKTILENQEELILSEPTKHSDPSWFGFPFTIKSTSKINRSDLIKFLDKRKIATRLLFAGNILRQPGYLNINSRKISSLENSNVILENSLWVGVHPGLNEEMIRYTGESILEFLKASR
jgi:CDP-6-deoxy-D-xylo-4-hexulose-3-dehydrase